MNNLRWTISWRSQNEDLYTLSIYDATGYQGNPVELTGGAAPFVTKEKSSDDFYAQVCTQSGKIEFVVTDADTLRQMMPTKATDRPVVLRKEVDGAEEVCWVGFISGELFTQPWDVMPYTVTVPVVSIMEAMRGVAFTQDEGATSLRTIMRAIDIYIPLVGISVIYPSVMDLDVQVSNQNFREWKRAKKRSELGMGTDKYISQSLYDVVEAFCQYFGVSLREDAGKMTFVTHDWTVTDFAYYEDSLGGSVVQVTPSVDTLPQMVLFGADGNVGYSKAYRRVVGTFETGADKGSELFKFGNVWDDFNLYNIYNSRSASTHIEQALFYGDTEVVPWRNATRNEVGPLIERGTPSTFNSGGQVAYLPDLKAGLWYFSIKDRAVLSAVEINMERPLYLTNNKSYVITIDIHALRWLPTAKAEGYTGRIYFTLALSRNGTMLHYLRAYTGGGADLINYEWTDSYAQAYVQLKDGEIEKDAIDASTAGTSSGLQIPYPAPFPEPAVYETGPYQLSMVIKCNAESAEEWEEGVTVKSVFIDRLNISYSAQPAADIYADQIGETNEIGVVNDNNYKEEYSLRCPITTSASALSIFGNTFQLQSGPGIALDGLWNYISERYDRNGIVRRAAMYAKPREILELPVMERVKSYDHVQIQGQVYAVMSRNTDWRDGRTNVKIINIQ